MGTEETMIVDDQGATQPLLRHFPDQHNTNNNVGKENGRALHGRNSPFTPTLIFSIFTVACGCFTTGCIVGYSSPVEYAIVEELGLSVAEYSVFGSMMIIGGLFAALTGGKIAELIGRKLTLMGVAGLYIVGWLTIASAKDAWQLDLGRLVQGIGSTLTLYLTPLYVAEISPKNVRGTAISLAQLTAMVGISFTFLVGSIINWRTMALIGATSGVLQLLFTVFVPESPRWLVSPNKLLLISFVFKLTVLLQVTIALETASQAKTDKSEQFEAALLRLRGENEDISWEIEEIKEYTKTIQSISKESSIFSLFQKQYAIPLLVGNGLLALEQFAGMNSYMFYMGAIFVSAGISNTIGFLVVSIVQLLAAILTTALLDRYGRRPLLLVSALGTCCGSLLTALSYILKGYQGLSEATPALALLSVVIFMGAMSLGNGISWIIVAEIFPQNIKGSAGSMCILSCNISSLLVTLSFQSLLQWSSSGTFLIYAGVSAVAIIFVAKFVPETKGRTLEEIQSSFTHK
ncbi:Sugar transporter ERD6-like 15 [Linum grandiflorum]